MITIIFSISILILADEPIPISNVYLKYGSPNSANCSQSHPCHSLDVAIARSQKEKTTAFTFYIMEHTVLIDEFAPSVTQFGKDTEGDVKLKFIPATGAQFFIYGSGTILLEGTTARSLSLTVEAFFFATSHNPGGMTKDYYICVKPHATFAGIVVIHPLDKSAFRPLSLVATLDPTKWDGSGPFVFQIDGGSIAEDTLESMLCLDPSAAFLDIRSTDGLGTSLTFLAAKRALYSEIIRQVKITNTTEFTLKIDNTITQGIAIKNSGCKISFQNHSTGSSVPDYTTSDLFLDGEAKTFDGVKKVDLPVRLDEAHVGKVGHIYNLTTKSDVVFVRISPVVFGSSFGPEVWNNYVVEVMRTKYTKRLSDKAQTEWVEMKKVVGHGGATPHEQGFYSPKFQTYIPESSMRYLLDTSEIKTKGDFYSVRVRTTTGTLAYLDRVPHLTDHDIKELERRM
ncbi:hypothetical protein BLNAU_11638 [Blattamonas nauphoetae]|uniref:Uncharacterized protein n=1 Tax=Blattamonas nauphoetae TaxID=2049346 RepID=A0ABQ9XLQ6_9EUKA|nr:hypothetical protein BLNAU_11638 [Blattamonas nauphoetae]